MRKLLILTVALAMALCNMAQESKSPAPKEKKNIREAVYRHTGGKLKAPGEQKGRIVWVNTQNKASAEWVKEMADYFAAMIHVQIDVESGNFRFPDVEVAGNATLYIIDDNNMPTILHAPESRWTMVNVSRLNEGDGKKPAFYEARVKKELVRAFCLLAGTQKSNYPESLLGCVTKPSDLDEFPNYELPVDIPTRFHEYLSGFGIKPYRLTTYRKACQEGWAPQPTNDVQKAIWDETHQLPTKPIKIEYDAKKGK